MAARKPALVRSLALGALLGLAREASAAGGAPVEAPGAVTLGERTLFVLAEAQGVLDPAARARVARSRLDDALLDPTCGPEGVDVLEEPAAATIVLCARHVVVVTEADATREGGTPAEVAWRWASGLREAFGAEKQALLGGRLLRRALLAVLIPLAFLGSLALARLLMRRIAARLLRVEGRGALRIGPLPVLSSSVARRALAQGLSVLRWTLYLVVIYVFVIVFLEQFPGTRRWGAELLEPVTELAARTGRTLVSLVPRLVLALVVLILARGVLASLGRLFAQVRAGRVRIEPLLTVESAGPAELTARVLVVAVALLLLALLVPGEPGRVVLFAFGLAALGLVLAGRDALANVLGGLVTLYMRPFRTGQRVRTAGVEGVVRAKGFLHVSVETDDGRTVLLPNGWVLTQPVEVVGDGGAIHLEVVVDSPGGPETAAALFRDAAAEIGCPSEGGRVALTGLRDGSAVFELQWPPPAGCEAAEARSRFLRALLARARALGVRLLAVHPRP
jgi:hypothetical protein